jgi:hypothetical protein
LCDAPDAAALYALPLPAAHLRLGPLPLRDALLTLAGPAWDVSVDDAARAVCFTRVTTRASPSANPIPANRRRVRRPTESANSECPRRPSHDHPAASRRERRPRALVEDRSGRLAAAREHPGRGQQRGPVAPDEQSQASAQDAHVQALNTRVAELEQQAAASKNQPKPVAQPDFEAARKALDERLAQVEQAQAADAHAGDMQGAAGARGRHRSPHEERRPPRHPGAPPSGQAQGARAAVQRRGRGAARRRALPVDDGTARPRRCWTCGCCAKAMPWARGNCRRSRRSAAVFRVDGQTQRVALP